MPSWYETFPLPPLEAMACGSAVVATALGTEDYAFDGKNSRVVQPRNPEALAEALLSIAQDPAFALRLAQAGLKTAAEHTWEKAVPKLEAILQAELAATGESPYQKLNAMCRGSKEPAAAAAAPRS